MVSWGTTCFHPEMRQLGHEIYVQNECLADENSIRDWYSQFWMNRTMNSCVVLSPDDPNGACRVRRRAPRAPSSPFANLDSVSNASVDRRWRFWKGPASVDQK